MLRESKSGNESLKKVRQGQRLWLERKSIIMDSQYSTDTLTDLLQVLEDGKEGLLKAAEAVKDPILLRFSPNMQASVLKWRDNWCIFLRQSPRRKNRWWPARFIADGPVSRRRLRREMTMPFLRSANAERIAPSRHIKKRSSKTFAY